MYNECTFLHEYVVFDKTDHKAKKKKKLNTTCKYHEIIYFSYKIEKKNKNSMHVAALFFKM